MKLLWLLLCVLFLQDQVPYKPNEQFEIKLDFKFKPRPGNAMGSAVIEMEKRVEQNSSSSLMLPYLYLNVKVLKLEELEQRVRVENNLGATLMARKAEAGMEAKLDLGFTDDIKDRVSSHEYIVSFLSKDKQHLSRIVIFFDEDGTYLVNGEKRGKL